MIGIGKRTNWIAANPTRSRAFFGLAAPRAPTPSPRSRVPAAATLPRITAASAASERAEERSGQPVLVKAAALHDGGEVRALFLKQVEVAERIAIHQQQIREGVRRDHSQLTLMTQEPSGDGGGRLDDLERLHHLAPDQELAALLFLELAEQVASVGHRHPRALADLERAKAVLQHE